MGGAALEEANMGIEARWEELGGLSGRAGSAGLELAGWACWEVGDEHRFQASQTQ